jgi:O-antigen/teichoic acid export membrane protein
MAFLDAGVFAFAYPALIKLLHQQNHGAAKAKVRQMLVHTLVLSAGFSIFSWLALPYLLSWIGNPVYQNAQHWYPWLLTAMVMNALSMVPHFALYAGGQDRHIIYSHIGALLVFVLTVWATSSAYAALAVPLGLNAAFAFILLWKTASYLAQNTRQTDNSVLSPRTNS